MEKFRQKFPSIGKPDLWILGLTLFLKSLKYIDRATPKEFGEYYAHERKHNISGLVTLRLKRTRRAQVIKAIKRPAFTFEKDTRQGMLL